MQHSIPTLAFFITLSKQYQCQKMPCDHHNGGMKLLVVIHFTLRVTCSIILHKADHSVLAAVFLLVEIHTVKNGFLLVKNRLK